MSLTLNSIRTVVTHASIIRGAPALFMGVSRLSQTISRPAIQRNFSTFGRRAAPKEENTTQKVRAPRMRPRPQYYNQPTWNRQLFQQKPIRWASRTNQHDQSGWSGRSFWRRIREELYQMLFSGFLDFLYNYLQDRLEEAIEEIETKSCSEAETPPEASSPQDEFAEDDVFKDRDKERKEPDSAL